MNSITSVLRLTGLLGTLFFFDGTAVGQSFSQQGATNHVAARHQAQELIKHVDNYLLLGLVVTGSASVLLTISLVNVRKSRQSAYQHAAELQRLAVARNQYLGIIAHDLRSPLLAMQGLYGLVKESLQHERYDDLEGISHYIDTAGIHTTHLLDNLFSWGMLQDGRPAHQPRQLNVREEITTVLDLYAGVNVLKPIRFTIDCPEAATAVADRDHAQVILRNLVDNAVKHLPPTHGEVAVQVAAPPAGQLVCIAVQDNGPGMGNELLASVNDAFRYPSKAQPGANGLGLGIVTIAGLVERNLGSITVKSTPGAGTRFELYLPTRN